MTHQLGAPLGGTHHFDDDVDDDDMDGMGKGRSSCPRIHPWCSTDGCTERPLRQFTAPLSKEIVFMCKTHFMGVPAQTRDGWKQYRGQRMFPESKVAVECRPGPGRVLTNTGEPKYTCPDEEKGKVHGKNLMWPGKIYHVLYQVWNNYVESKRQSTGDSHMTSTERAELVPEAARVLREQGHIAMAEVLEGTSEGARKVVHNRMVSKYLKPRETFIAKLRQMGLEAGDVLDWEAALDAAQTHLDHMPVKEIPEVVGGEGSSAPNGVSRKGKIPRKRRLSDMMLDTPEGKRARALEAMVAAAERANLLQKGVAEAENEHLRRMELADAERLNMEKEEHALRIAIGNSALALLNKMANQSNLTQSNVTESDIVQGSLSQSNVVQASINHVNANQDNANQA